METEVETEPKRDRYGFQNERECVSLSLVAQVTDSIVSAGSSSGAALASSASALKTFRIVLELSSSFSASLSSAGTPACTTRLTRSARPASSPQNSVPSAPRAARLAFAWGRRIFKAGRDQLPMRN